MRTPTSGIRRCAIYTRKSIAKGLDQEFNSLDAQQDFCMKFIESHGMEGWVYVGTYTDAAVSGTTVEREQLTMLRHQVKAGALDCVVVYKLDRLSRDLTDFTVLMREFADNGVTFVSATQAMEAETPEGKLSMNMMAVVADYEAAIIRARIRDKLRATRAQGRWVGGRPPLGYEMSKKGLLINPAEAETVRRVFNLYLQGNSMADIARTLNNEGRLARSRKSGQWIGPFVRRVLENPVYAGLIRDEDRLIQGIHIPIIDPEVWKMVCSRLAEKTLTQPTGKDRPVFPLRGILTCGRCGRDYIGVRARDKNDIWHRYYICASASSHNAKPCGNSRFSATALEALLIRYILTFRQDGQLLIALLERMKDEDARQVTDCFNSLDIALSKASLPELQPVFRAVFRKVAFNINGRQLDVALRNFPRQKVDGLPCNFPLIEKLASVNCPNGSSIPQLSTRDSARILSETLAPVKVPNGYDFSIPIMRERDSKSAITLRVRTQEDDMIEKAQGAGQRPTKRAIRMANAIMMERLLTTGKFGSANQFAMAIGVSQTLISNTLKMLNLPPEEIEAILFETK